MFEDRSLIHPAIFETYYVPSNMILENGNIIQYKSCDYLVYNSLPPWDRKWRKWNDEYIRLFNLYACEFFYTDVMLYHPNVLKNNKANIHINSNKIKLFRYDVIKN